MTQELAVWAARNDSSGEIYLSLSRAARFRFLHSLLPRCLHSGTAITSFLNTTLYVKTTSARRQASDHRVRETYKKNKKTSVILLTPPLEAAAPLSYVGVQNVRDSLSKSPRYEKNKGVVISPLLLLLDNHAMTQDAGRR